MSGIRSLLGGVKSSYLHAVTDYYFISFPKSGRTWTKSVLANYYALAEDVPVFHDFSPVVKPRRRSAIPRIVFTHANHLSSDADAAGYITSLRKKRVILLVRDPAEVTQTFYYRLLKRMQRPELANMDMDEFALSETLGLPQILRFMRRWFDARQTFAGFHLLRYEDAVADPLTEFADLLGFLGTDVDEDLLQQALNRSLDTTRKIETGGTVRDAAVIADIEAGDSVYLGREDAQQLERFDGSGHSIFEQLRPETAARMRELLDGMPPAVVAPFGSATAQPNESTESQTK